MFHKKNIYLLHLVKKTLMVLKKKKKTCCWLTAKKIPSLRLAFSRIIKKLWSSLWSRQPKMISLYGSRMHSTWLNPQTSQMSYKDKKMWFVIVSISKGQLTSFPPHVKTGTQLRSLSGHSLWHTSSCRSDVPGSPKEPVSSCWWQKSGPSQDPVGGEKRE